MPDSPSAWLRSLAAEATPSFPNRWRSMNEEPPRVAVLAPAGVWVNIPYDEHDARLIALAPDLAVLCADAIDALEHVEELRLWEPGKAGYAAVQNRALELSGALLARFAALQPERGGGAA